MTLPRTAGEGALEISDAFLKPLSILEVYDPLSHKNKHQKSVQVKSMRSGAGAEHPIDQERPEKCSCKRDKRQRFPLNARCCASVGDTATHSTVLCLPPCSPRPGWPLLVQALSPRPHRHPRAGPLVSGTARLCDWKSVPRHPRPSGNHQSSGCASAFVSVFFFFFKELNDIKRIDKTGKNALEKPRNEVTRIRNE